MASRGLPRARARLPHDQHEVRAARQLAPALGVAALGASLYLGLYLGVARDEREPPPLDADAWHRLERQSSVSIRSRTPPYP